MTGRMPGALFSLAVRLTGEPEFAQQLAHAVGADRMAHSGQARRKLVEALRHPQQRTHRIAQRHWLHQAPEVIEQRRIALRQGPRAATVTAHPAGRKCRPIEVLQATLDRAACQPADLRDRHQATPSGSPRLARSKQSTAALVPLRAVRIPPSPDRLFVYHTHWIPPSAATRNPSCPSHKAASTTHRMRFLNR